MSPRWQSLSRRAGAAALVLGLCAGATSLSADGQEDEPSTQEELDAVRSQQAEEASELDALRATDEEVTAALTALNDDVRNQEAAAADAQAEAERAADEAQRAQNEEAQAEEAQAEVQQRLTDLAVDSYVGAGSTDPVFELLAAEDIDEGFRAQALTDVAAGNEADLLDEMAALEEDAQIARETAEEASARAAEAQAEAEQHLAELEEAQARKQEFAAQVDQRIEASLAEAAVLQDQNAELSAQLAAEQAALAALSGGGGGGGGTLPPVGNVGVTNVRGIWVASSIAGQLESMLSAASSAGINLSGSGYRDPAAQIAVRRSNCGSSQYAIYEMSPSACSPPTARPGTSMHERGLAIDFTYNGALIQSRGSAGFQWLAGNASSYGFYNLPSEPWHWSTTGG